MTQNYYSSLRYIIPKTISNILSLNGHASFHNEDSNVKLSEKIIELRVINTEITVIQKLKK